MNGSLRHDPAGTTSTGTSRRTKGRGRGPRRIIAAISAVGMLASLLAIVPYVAPARADELSTNVVEMFDVPETPSWLVAAGDNAYYTALTKEGIVASEFGHTSNADASLFSASSPYPDTTIGWAALEILIDDVDGRDYSADALDAVAVRDDGSRYVIEVGGPKSAGFPRRDLATLSKGELGDFLGAAIFPDPGAGKRIALFGSENVQFYEWETDGLHRRGTQHYPLGFDATPIGGNLRINQGDLLDAWQRPMWDHMPHEVPYHEMDRLVGVVGRAHPDPEFRPPGVGENVIAAMLLEFDPTTKQLQIWEAGLPGFSGGINYESTGPGTVSDARVRYDHNARLPEVGPYGASEGFHMAVLHAREGSDRRNMTFITDLGLSAPWPSEVEQHVQLGGQPVCTASAPGDPLDLSFEVLDLGEGHASAWERSADDRWVMAAACAHGGGNFFARSSTFVKAQARSRGIDLSNGGVGSDDLPRARTPMRFYNLEFLNAEVGQVASTVDFPCASFLVEYPTPFGEFTCDRTGSVLASPVDSYREWPETIQPSDRTRVSHPSSVVTHTVSMEYQTGAPDSPADLSLGFIGFTPPDFDCSTGSCELGPSAATAHSNRTVLQEDLVVPPEQPLMVKLPTESHKVTVEFDSTDFEIVAAGDPMPVAVLAAPPTVPNAQQDVEEPVFANASGGGVESDVSHTDEIGVSVGYTNGVDIPFTEGDISVSVKASLEAIFTTGETVGRTFEVSNFYEGSPQKHSIVYRTMTGKQLEGRIIDNDAGYGLATDEDPPNFSLFLPLTQTTTVRPVDSFAATYPDAWATMGPSVEAALPGGTASGDAHPGQYVPFDAVPGGDIDSSAIDDYCIGDVDGVSDGSDTYKTPGTLQLNPFQQNPRVPPGPGVLLGDTHTVENVDESLVAGSAFSLTEDKSDYAVSETLIGAEVATEVLGVTLDTHYERTEGTGITTTLSSGTSFTSGVGGIPSPLLEDETYLWKPFLCQRYVNANSGHFPVWVMNYAVNGYNGSGGLEPIGPITQTGPIQSEVTSTRPLFSWSQPEGTTRSYDIELEAIGANDARTFTGLNDRTSDTTTASARTSNFAFWDELGSAPLLEGQLYRWRVTGLDFFGETTASDFGFFVTAGPPQDVQLQLADPTPVVGEATIANVTHDPIDGDVDYELNLCDGTVVTSDEPSFEVVFAHSGVCPLTVVVTGPGGSSSSQFTAVVGPKVADRTIAILEDTPRSVPADIGMLLDSVGADQVVSTTPPDHGTLDDWSADGSFAYTPDANYCGNDSFTYTASGGGVTRSAQVTFDVTCVNDAPTVPDKSYTTVENEGFEDPLGDLVDGYEDVEGHLAASLELVSEPADGFAALRPSTVPFEDPIFGPAADFFYAPDEGFCGTDSFTYTATDHGDPPATSEPITVTIEVTCVNDPPVANADPPVTVTEDGSSTFDVLGNDTDTDDDPLTAVVSTAPVNGTAVVEADGRITYTPDPDYCGDDSLAYVADDGLEQSTPVTIDATVTCVPDAPMTAPDFTVTLSEDDSTAVDLAGGATDADGDEVTAVITAAPANGDLADEGDGTFTYTPDANYCGADSITYHVTDGELDSEDGTVTIDVTCVNDAPVAVADPTITLDEDTSATATPLANDTDVEGTELTLVVTDEPALGELDMAPDGTVTYTPDADACGADSFTYVADDGEAQSDPVTVAIEVTCVNDAPVAAADPIVTLDEDTSASATPLANDSDVDGDDLSVSIVDQPEHGTLDVVDGAVGYTPDADYCGDDSLTYVASDGELTSNPVTILVSVACVNDPPVVNPDPAVHVDEDEVVTTDPLANDVDVDGDELTLTITDEPTDGTVEVDGDGVVTYTPDPDACGTDSYTYVVSDGELEADPVTVEVTVACVNDPPVLGEDDPVEVDEDGTVTTDPLANDTDVDGDDLFVIVTEDPTDGTVEVDEDSKVTYTPDPDACGTDSYTYVVTDGIVESDPVVVEVEVACVNDAPVAEDDSYTMDEDGTLEVPEPGVLGNDTDIDSAELSASVADGPADGDVDVADDGGVTYTPDEGFYGEDSFTYEVDDGDGGTAEATVTIRVKGRTRLVAEPVVLRVRNLFLYVAHFRATLTDSGGEAVAGREVAFNVLGTTRCTATTNANGVARCSVTLFDWVAAILSPYHARFTGDVEYQSSGGQSAIIR